MVSFKKDRTGQVYQHFGVDLFFYLFIGGDPYKSSMVKLRPKSLFFIGGVLFTSQPFGCKRLGSMLNI